jgi:hypothetical protein
VNLECTAVYVHNLCALKVRCLERLAWNGLVKFGSPCIFALQFNRVQSDFFQNNSVDIKHIAKQLDTSLKKFVSV